MDISGNIEDIKRVAVMDRLLAKANVHRMREEYIEAEDAYREALGLDENRPDIREFLGDVLHARGQMDAALAEYKTVLEMEPGRVSAETKYARIILEISEREHQKQIAQEMLDNPKKFEVTDKHPLLSFMLSAAVPGLGQIYNGTIAKGAIIFGAFLLSLLVLAMSRQDMANLIKNFAIALSPGSITEKSPPVGGLVILFFSIASFIYIYAVIDAPIAAAKTEKPEEK